MGDVWGVDSIRPNAFGVSSAWRAPTGYQFEWFTGADRLSAYTRSEQTPAGQVVGLVYRDDRHAFEFNGVESVAIRPDGIRTLATNGGHDVNATYFPAVSATDQWQAQTRSGALYLNRNSGTTSAPVWSNRGRFDATTGTYSSVSDRLLKKAFAPFEPDARKLINGLAGAVSYYAMKEDEDSVQQLGFLAQDLQAALPQAVTSGDGVPLMVSDRPILAALATACMYLLEEIEALKARVE